MKGVVYRIVRDRGFGFIRGEDGLSRFFHCRDLAGVSFDLLTEQTDVSFVPEMDGDHDNKLRAKQVMALGARA